MPLEKIRILSILIAAASIAAFLVGDFGPGFLAVQTAVMIPLWFPIKLDVIRAHPAWRWYALATFAAFIATRLVGFSMRTSVFLLILFCIVYEYYGERRINAPVRLLSLLSFLIVVYQARFDTGLNLLYGVALYLAAVVFCMAAYHGTGGRRGALRDFTRRYGVSLIGHAAVVFALGMVIFWLIPRLPDQTLAALPDFSGKRISGFSNTVTLNDIGSLKLSRKHVLDLKPLDGALHSRYLRGRAFDYYANGVWTNSSVHSFYPTRRQGGVYRFAGASDAPRYDYRIDTEAMQGNPIFFFHRLVEIESRVDGLRLEGYLDHLSVMRGFPLAMSYTVRAYDEDPPGWPGTKWRDFLQMPDNHGYMAREAELALADDPGLTDPRRIAVLFQQRFYQNFQYTLDIRNSGAADPLRDFLEKRRGHCELFASAMVLMLRSRGIPARLVTGFLLPDIHASGEFYYVTESDAHAWVEYYADDAWRTIDPTPPAVFATPYFAEQQIAYLKHFWRNMVMTFDFEAQAALWRGLLDALAWLAAVAKNHPLRLTAALLLAAFLFIYRRRLLAGLTRPERRLTKDFKRLEALLRKRFSPRRSDEPVADYVRRLPLPAPVELALLHFLDAYAKLRYGREAPTPEAAAYALNLARDARRRLNTLEER